MPWQVFRTGRLTDGQIVKLAQDGTGYFRPSSASIRIAGADTQLDDDVMALFKGKKSYGIYSFNLEGRPDGFSLYFRRGTGGMEQSMDPTTPNGQPSRQANAFFDEVGIYSHLQSGTPGERAEHAEAAVSLVAKHLKLIDDPTLDRVSAQGTDALQAQFARMADLMVSSTEEVHSIRLKLEQEAVERQQTFAQQVAKHAEESAERMRRMDEDHAARVAELDAEKKAIDNRNNMIVRRELRTQMTREIADRLAQPIVPQRTSRLRTYVLLLSLLGSFACAAVSAWSFYEYAETLVTVREALIEFKNDGGGASSVTFSGLSYAGWALLIRGILSGVAAIGLLLYSISWLKSVYNDEVRTQRDLERYAVDLNRASWAVETIMEAKASGDVAVPDLVIAGVTRGLFEGTGSHSGAGSAGSLIDLLQSTTEAEFGPTGAKFKLNGKGAKRLAERLEDE